MKKEKSYEEKELDSYIESQARTLADTQKIAQIGSEMKNWVAAGHYTFIQSRVLNPIEIECFKKVKKARLSQNAIASIAKVQGTLEVFDLIAARIDNIIQNGEAALLKLNDLQNSTLKEGE